MSEDRARKAIDLFIKDNPDLGYFSVDHFINDMTEIHSNELKNLVAREDFRGPELIRKMREGGLHPSSVSFIDHGRRIKIVHGNGSCVSIVSAYKDDNAIINDLKTSAGIE